MTGKTKARWHDVLFVKGCVMWGLVVLCEATEWDARYDRLSGILWVLTCLTTTAFVLVRIEVGHEAWRRGYKAALEDIARVQVDDEAEHSNVSRLHR